MWEGYHAREMPEEQKMTFFAWILVWLSEVHRLRARAEMLRAIRVIFSLCFVQVKVREMKSQLEDRGYWPLGLRPWRGMWWFFSITCNVNLIFFFSWVFQSTVHFLLVICRIRSFWENRIKWGLWSKALVKNLPANAGDTGSIPGLGRSPGEGNGDSLQYSCLGNPLHREAWWATVQGVTESDTT